MWMQNPKWEIFECNSHTSRLYTTSRRIQETSSFLCPQREPCGLTDISVFPQADFSGLPRQLLKRLATKSPSFPGGFGPMSQDQALFPKLSPAAFPPGP